MITTLQIIMLKVIHVMVAAEKLTAITSGDDPTLPPLVIQ